MVAPSLMAVLVSRRARRLVIVDDHDSFRSSVRALLTLEGFDVVGEAPDATSATRMVVELRPEVALVDVTLPDMDGIALAWVLARLPDPPDVVLVSSRDAASYGPRLTTAPVRGFLPKGELSGAALDALLS